MSKATIKNGRYTVESLYQWDQNQVLEVHGLSLDSNPEIHFTNDAMDGAIPRQATRDNAGIIRADIPNSLLQKPYTIKAYICIYEGETFITLFGIDIPVKARPKPYDYILENDEEIYSFNTLKNLVNNVVNNYTEAYNLLNDSNSKLTTAIGDIEQSKKDYESAVTAYNDSSKMVNDFVENNGDVLSTVNSKANKPIISEVSLLATGWSDNTYSFEASYPVATYDIEIALNSTATSEQAQAFNSAQIVGSATSNIVTAFGNVPTVDIPIIVKAVTK